MNPKTTKFATLMGSASFFTLAQALGADAQQVAQAQMAQAAPTEVPEQVLITGSLIRGTVAVGVPVTNLSVQDLRTTGSLTTADLFRTIPQFNVIPGPVGTQAANNERGTRVNLRQLDTGSAPRSLMMVDGVRYPPQGNGLCQIDPSIIPEVAIDRVDLLLDGASATYGSDAIGGVINIILKRNFDGAVTEVGFQAGAGGNQKALASQLYGRTWEGGDIVIGLNWYNVNPTKGNFSSRYTFDFSPWGLDNRTPLASATPGIISVPGVGGAPTSGGQLGAPFATDSTNYPATNGHNCLNCFSIPAGTGSPFNPINNGLGPIGGGSAATLSWGAFAAANGGMVNGTRNEFNPYAITTYSAGQQYVGSELTIDQRLFPGVSFYGEGIYGLRRSQFIANSTVNQFTFGVPTVNPYYPTGAPNGLRVSYSFSIESPDIQDSYASAQRYLFGLNIDLPFGWAAQTYYSETRDAEYTNIHGVINRAAVSAALGWTIPAQGASGTVPGIAAFTKPATIPYLNVFCDPTEFMCNSPTTLAFISAYNESKEAFWINEKAIKADGPLFDLPGGTVRAAVGALYDSNHFLITQTTETSTSNTLTTILQDPEFRSVWAFFTQVNVPIIGDANALPLIRKLQLEGSWRHDQYSDVGGTSNPKVAFDWLVSEDIGLTLRGSWGTSFRAPSFGEFSPISNVAWNGWGLSSAPGAAQFQNNSPIVVSCDPKTGAPPPGSGAAKLFAAGFACNSQPEGLSLNGGGKAAVLADFRTFTNQQNQTLKPEQATNWSAGFEFSPTTFLRGLDIQATWYTIKINGLLINFGNPTSNRLADPQIGFAFLLPSDVGCPVSANQHPETCANFEDMVSKALSQPTNPVPIAALSLIKWINDGGTVNTGFQRNSGIDFNASYDIDLGDLGAWNAGITGTYYLEQLAARVNGGDVADVQYHVDLSSVGGVAQNGVESLPRFKYRARLGWSSGPFSVVGFMDYASHFFHTQAAPPNVNFQCLTSGGTVGGGSLPCAISNYTNMEPPYYSFDLSFQYDTQDMPANDYLKHIQLQLVIQNLFDKHSPFEYRIATGGGNPAAFDITKSIFGRQFQIRMVKNW